VGHSAFALILLLSTHSRSAILSLSLGLETCTPTSVEWPTWRNSTSAVVNTKRLLTPPVDTSWRSASQEDCFSLRGSHSESVTDQATFRGRSRGSSQASRIVGRTKATLESVARISRTSSPHCARFCWLGTVLLQGIAGPPTEKRRSCGAQTSRRHLMKCAAQSWKLPSGA